MGPDADDLVSENLVADDLVADDLVADDRALLARFSPVLRLADGERFLPIAVDGYVAACELRERGGRRTSSVIAPEGAVALPQLDELAGGRADVHLRFVNDERRREARRISWRRARPEAPVRLARVGLLGRVADALFRLSLVLRGTVAPGVAAAAAQRADELGLHRRPACYARVVREGGWLVLHYWFFYVMNDWRSGFGGVNDHEADWEQAFVVIDEATMTPVWVGAAMHDHSGADLRRRWDDPELAWVGEHPVLHVAGGSHAMYFQPGDYLSRVEVPAVRVLMAVRDLVRRMAGLPPAAGGLGIPYVDIAASDGLTLGAGGDQPLDVLLLERDAPWVVAYGGLWGLDTDDRTGGERAPAGPRFERGGAIRRAWHDPLGFLGLHSESPPSAEGDLTAAALAALEDASAIIDREIESTRTLARGRHRVDGPRATQEDSRTILRLTARRQELTEEAARLRAGERAAVGPRDHLHRPAVPEPIDAKRRALLGWWGALSGPLLLLLASGLFLSDLRLRSVGFAVAVLAVLTIEALLQRRLRSLFVGVGLVAGAVIAVTAVARYGALAIGAALGALAVLVAVANVREVLHRE